MMMSTFVRKLGVSSSKNRRRPAFKAGNGALFFRFLVLMFASS